MPIEPRDARFLEFAVASGRLDAVHAQRLYDLRRQSPAAMPIETFAVEHGFITPAQVQEIISYARGAATQSEAVPPPAPPSTNTYSDNNTFSGTSTFASENDTYGGDNTFADQGGAKSLSGSLGGSRDTDTTKDDPSKQGPARLGHRFGPYEILGELGRGGMGAVYRARKDGDATVVALKVLSDEKNPNEATVRRFEREIRAGREIDHPNIVRIFDAGEVEGRLFFTMELIDGRSMDKIVEELPLRMRIEMFEKIARAVNQAHVRGYIHRDLKPQNIMVTEDLEPKVADFGLAKSLDRESRLTKTGAILGTIAYMSPEQAEGGNMHKLDGRTDIYSLGAILYQLICGTVPFKAATNYGTIGLILTQDPEPPSKVDPKCPEGLSAIALKALEKEPAKRFQTAAELADEVARWLQGTKVVTHGPTIGDKVAKGVKRRRLPLGAVLLIAVVAAATMKVLAWKHQREHQAHLEEAKHDVDGLLTEVARPGATADLADRLDALEARLQTLPELAERARVVHGLALVARSLEKERAPEEARPYVAAALAAAPARWDVRRAYVNVLERLGEPTLAARSIEEFRANADAQVREATDPEALERLGLARLEAGDPVGARAAFEAGARSKLLLARTLGLLGDPGAAAVARSLPASDEQAPVLLEARLAAEPGEAIDGLRLIERTKKTPELELRIAQALVRAERGAEALAEIGRARALKANERAVLATEAEALLLEGRPREACRSLDEAAKLCPKGSFARVRLLARKARIQLVGGVEPTREALAEAPDEPIARLAFAGEDAAQLEKLAPALGTRPEAVSAWCALARARAKAGDEKGAREARAKALALAPQDEEALAADPDKARAAFAHGRGDGARLLRASLAAAKLYTYTSWKREEDGARSEVLLACAERAAPWAGAIAIERARRLLAQGEASRAAAKQALERAVALSPNDPDGLVLLASLVDPPRMEELATRALALEPENARALSLRGQARVQLKRAAEALADLDASLRLDAHDGDAWAAKAAALEALGKPSAEVAQEARIRRSPFGPAMRALDAKDWERAYDLCPGAPEVMKGVIDASFRGDYSGHLDPILLYSRIIALNPAHYLRGIFDREAATQIQPTLADAHEGPDADSDELFEAFVLRCVGIVRTRDSHPETLARARLDLERCLGKEPANFCAVGGRGFVLALERQTELAADDLKRVEPYVHGRVNVFTFGEALVRAQRGENYDAQLAALAADGDDRKTLLPWAKDLAKGAH